MITSRVYRNGAVAAETEDVSAAAALESLAESDTSVWIDICGPEPDELRRVVSVLGVHELAVEDACTRGERTKLETYADQLVLTAYAASLDQSTGRMRTAELTVFVGERWLVTVRKDPDFPIERVVQRWDDEAALAGHGVGFLLWGLLDVVVDGHYAVVGALEDAVEELEDQLFGAERPSPTVQRRSFEARKSLVAFRRVALPMREVVDLLLQRNPGPPSIVDAALQPYYRDVRDHAVRAVEWSESLREVVGTIIDTDATLRNDVLNDATKKLSAWAAILVVPTLITGFYGMNTALYPKAGSVSGFWLAVGLILVPCTVLYAAFRRRDWL